MLNQAHRCNKMKVEMKPLDIQTELTWLGCVEICSRSPVFNNHHVSHYKRENPAELREGHAPGVAQPFF